MTASKHREGELSVLFILKGKGKYSEISPFIQSQANSLQDQKIRITFFVIKGKGMMPYLTHAGKLRSFVKKNSFDIIHAHYALSGWTALLSFCQKPIVLSLMGSDILGEYQNENKISRKSKVVVFLTTLLQFFVKAIISKSENIHNRLYRKTISTIIPNGINTDIIRPHDKDFRKELGLKPDGRYVLFLGNPADKWKNIDLARKAIELLENKEVELLEPFPLPPQKVVQYLNAVDVFLHTSFMEGSSNVIKEAMACNCPVVTTDVGDAKWVTENTKACYLTDFTPEDVAEKLKLALAFAQSKGRTNGYDQILRLGLDAESIAKRIVLVYKSVL